MKLVSTGFEGLSVVELDRYEDERGSFMERFQEKHFQAMGLPSHFPQDNHSRSMPGVLRGLHFQHTPPQQKLVGVIQGRILDVVVDLRPSSSTFLKSFQIELGDQRPQLLWVPQGFAHGFAVLGDQPADVYYKVDKIYHPQGETGVFWADPGLEIPWKKWGITSPRVSDRDSKLPRLSEVLKWVEKNPKLWDISPQS